MENMYDGGILSLVLETELAFFNIEKELMREEARIIITESEADESKLKSKLMEIAKKIKEVWDTFVAKIKQVINKIVVSTKLAEKFLSQNEKFLNQFNGSTKKVKISPMLDDLSKFKEEEKHIKEAIRLAIKFFRTSILTPDLTEELKKQVQEATKRAITNSTEKVEVYLDKVLVKDSTVYLKKAYKLVIKEIEDLRSAGDKVVKKLRSEVERILKQQGEDNVTVKTVGFIYGMVGRAVVNLVMKVASKTISNANQVYVDSFKVCRLAVSVVKEQQKDSVKIVDEVPKGAKVVNPTLYLN
jgi:hypothetical protein